MIPRFFQPENQHLAELANSQIIRDMQVQCEELESQVTILFLQLTDLQELRNIEKDRMIAMQMDAQINNIISQHAQAEENVKAAKQQLSQYMQFNLPVEKQQFVESKDKAIAIYKFTDEDKTAIKNHYETLTKDIKSLLKAAMKDKVIAIDTILNPVFIRKDGHLLDANTVNDMFKEKHEIPHVFDRDKTFTKQDVIPCNSLLKAMKLMLDIIKEKKETNQLIEINPYLLEAKRKKISPDTIKLIEMYYQKKMEPKHRALFDAICRDTETNMIMDDPIFLPDGYAYDRRTALNRLESANFAGIKYATCPMDDSITFKEEDITNAYYVVDVLEQLEKNILEMKQAVEKAAEEAAKFPNMRVR